MVTLARTAGSQSRPSARTAAIALCVGLMGTGAGARAGSAQAAVARAPGQSPRTDGVYKLALPAKAGSTGTRHVAVRLYDDHTAVEVDHTGDAAVLPSRNDPSLLPGVWTLEDDQLTVTTSTGFAENTTTGKLTPAGWVISERVMYIFRPVAFPREAGGNRRPRFKGHGNAALRFNYDAAGNTVGASHELSIEAEDPDGDALTFIWAASNGTIVGQGPSAVWQRVLQAGRPLSGTITVTVTDGKGGRVESTTAMR